MLFDITQLYDRLKASDYMHFYEIESDFFQCFCSNPATASLPLINAFLIASSWFGTSERSGAWTFYEATNPERIQKAVDYLIQSGETELDAVIGKGIHDYQNPQYAEDFEYPEEWITPAQYHPVFQQKYAVASCHPQCV